MSRPEAIALYVGTETLPTDKDFTVGVFSELPDGTIALQYVGEYFPTREDAQEYADALLV